MRTFFKIKKLRKNKKKKKSFKRTHFTQVTKDKIWNRDSGCCVRCGINENIEFDHIIPVSRGGKSTYRNGQLLCEYHNRLKHNKLMSELNWEFEEDKQKRTITRLQDQVRKEKEYNTNLEIQKEKVDSVSNSQEEIIAELSKEVDKQTRPRPITFNESFESCIERIENKMDWFQNLDFKNPMDDDNFCYKLDEVVEESVEYYRLEDFPLPEWMIDKYDIGDGSSFIDERDWVEFISEHMVEVYNDLAEDGIFEDMKKFIEELDDHSSPRKIYPTIEQRKENWELQQAIEKQKDFLNHNIQKHRSI